MINNESDGVRMNAREETDDRLPRVRSEWSRGNSARGMRAISSTRQRAGVSHGWKFSAIWKLASGSIISPVGAARTHLERRVLRGDFRETDYVAEVDGHCLIIFRWHLKKRIYESPEQVMKKLVFSLFFEHLDEARLGGEGG